MVKVIKTKFKESVKLSNYLDGPYIIFLHGQKDSFYVHLDYPQRFILTIKIIKLPLHNGKTEHFFGLFMSIPRDYKIDHL